MKNIGDKFEKELGVLEGFDRKGRGLPADTVVRLCTKSDAKNTDQKHNIYLKKLSNGKWVVVDASDYNSATNKKAILNGKWQD